MNDKIEKKKTPPTIEEIKGILREKGHRISKGIKVRSLIQKQKGFLKTKRTLTNFDEPVLFLARSDGKMDIIEKATAGKYIFEHSNGKPRFIELRPADQMSFDYGDRKVRAYVAHENRPHAGWDDPVVDGETVMIGYEKTNATNSKYESKLQELKNKAKLTWLWVFLGIIGGIIALAIMVPSTVWDRILKQGAYAVNSTEVKSLLPLLLMKWRKK